MTTPACFALRGEGTDTLEIDIYDYVGRGAEWSGGASAKGVRAKLKDAKDAKEIRLRINSSGGEVIDGYAIYNLLNEHPAKVVAHVDALAASIASIILMAADEIHVANNAFIMIHNPWGYGMGEADDLRSQADVLDKMRDQLADIYVERTGQSRAKILKMMADETYLTASEAKALGFADFVKPSKKGTQENAARAQAFAFVNLASLEHVPVELRERVESARQSFGSEQTPVQTPNVNPPSRAEDQEKKNRMDQLATLLAALGASDVNAAIARHQQLARIEHATGKSGDEAQGVLLAFKASHEKLPGVEAELVKAQSRIDELEGAAESQQLDTAIAQANAEKKLTPALEKDIRDQVASGDLTIKGAQFALKNLQPIAALQAKQPAGPTGSAAKQGEQNTAVVGAGEGQNAAGVATFNGKTFAEMSGPERVELHKADAGLFARMQASFKPVRKSADGK